MVATNRLANVFEAPFGNNAVGLDDSVPLVYGVLFSGVVAVSFAAILIRLAEAPPLVIAFYRLAIASLVVGPLALTRFRVEPSRFGRPELVLSAASGVFLALHFAFWITSLDSTSVASSVVLVTTQPIFVALFSHLFTSDKVSLKVFLGILVAVMGGAIIGYGDLTQGMDVLLGDMLALVGATMSAGYFIAGRRVRRSVSLLPYIAIAYSSATALLLLMVLMLGLPLVGYSKFTYGMLLLLALVPQLVGHTSLNWALGYLSAPFVTVAILGEPIGATILAFFILKESPNAAVWLGGVLVLSGIYVALREETAHSQAKP